MTRHLPVATLVILLGLLCPGVAPAQQGTQAPPGLSGADQYLETVPDSGGGRTVGNGQRPSLDDPVVEAAAARALPPGTRAALAKQGRSGRDAAALAAKTAPDPRVMATPSERRAVARDTDAGASPFEAVRRAATGSGGGGMGLLFPTLLVVGTLFVAGSVRWRRRGDDLPA